MYTALQSSRAFAYQVARDFDEGRRSRAAAAGCLLHASEAAVQVALEVIQTLGGNGYINEYPAGRILRDAKLYAIGAGTNEIRRTLIGRELFDGRSRAKPPPKLPRNPTTIRCACIARHSRCRRAPMRGCSIAGKDVQIAAEAAPTVEGSPVRRAPRGIAPTPAVRYRSQLASMRLISGYL